jgi:hypothetical protein
MPVPSIPAHQSKNASCQRITEGQGACKQNESTMGKGLVIVPGFKAGEVHHETKLIGQVDAVGVLPVMRLASNWVGPMGTRPRTTGLTP